MSTKSVTLDQEQMKFLLQLLAYIVVAAPNRNWAQKEEFNKINPGWNPLRFIRDRVWHFLHETLGSKSHNLKNGIREHLLNDARRSVNTDSPSKTHDVETVFTDEVMRQTYNNHPHAVRACIESVAAVLASEDLSHFESLLCDQALTTDTSITSHEPTRFANQVTKLD